MKLVMSPEIPHVVREQVVPAVGRFLRGRPVTHWVLHPGGPRVLEAYGRSEAEIGAARASLRELGNLSSAAVLFLLSRLAPKRGETALVAAVGPGFGVEMSYLRW
jgi:alkylresorcinol/alkylpyrone synthase